MHAKGKPDMEFGWKTITWKLSDPVMVGYFFNRDSFLDSSSSSKRSCWTSYAGLVFWRNFCEMNATPYSALSIEPPVPTNRRIAHFIVPPTWSTTPLPCPAILKTRISGTANLLEISRFIGCRQNVVHTSGIAVTVSNIFSKTSVANSWSCLMSSDRIGW